MILRLPIEVRLFDENHEAVRFIRSTKKSQIRARLHGVSRSEWTFGVCRVWYSKNDDYWNEFPFTNFSQLDERLTVNTEKPLLDYLRGIIPSQYLEKRKVSVSQRRSVLKAQSKSTARFA